jgi:hypothetical protein
MGALWKYLEKKIIPYLERSVPGPEMFKRFVKIQINIPRFAYEDLNYLPEAVRVLASGSDNAAEFMEVRSEIERGVCRYALETGSTVTGISLKLPAPLNSPPFDKIVPRPEKMICN